MSLHAKAHCETALWELLGGGTHGFSRWWKWRIGVSGSSRLQTAQSEPTDSIARLLLFRGPCNKMPYDPPITSALALSTVETSTLPVRTTSQVAAYDERQQATVFSIDDDRAVQRGIARLLRSYGYSVETYASYTQFLSRPPVDGPGCILLDLLMPEEDGLQAQTALREAGVTLPIIFLTAYGDVAKQRDCDEGRRYRFPGEACR